MVYWIVKSDENAQIFAATTSNELKRIARKNLTTGFGRVKDKVTGEDKTKELLESDWAKGIHRRLRIEEMAKTAGLEKLYIQLYGALSMEAHGNVFGYKKRNVAKETLEVMALANVLLEGINLVVKAWIVNRKQTSSTEIYTVLKLSK